GVPGGQRVQRQLPTGGAGGTVEQPVQSLAGEGLELGKHAAPGLDDAGGGLGEQSLSVTGGTVDLGSQLALSGAETRPGKLQLLEAGVPGLAVLELLLRPVEEAFALQFEEGAQFPGPELLPAGRFLLGVDVVVDHRQL